MEHKHQFGLKKHQFGLRSGEGEYIDTVFESGCEVFGKPLIKYSVLRGGQVFDSPTIIESLFEDLPVISGIPTIFNSELSEHCIVTGGSQIIYSELKGQAVVADRAVIQHCKLSGYTRVFDDALCTYCELKGFSTICGDASLTGTKENPIVLKDNEYIHTGMWTRPPITKVASSGFVLTECVNGNVDIGCLCNKPEKFLKAGYRYMEMLGFSKEQTDEIKSLLEELQEERKQYEKI